MGLKVDNKLPGLEITEKLNWEGNFLVGHKGRPGWRDEEGHARKKEWLNQLGEWDEEAR